MDPITAARMGMITRTLPPRMDSARAPDAALLHLMWLASPALPVGGFSYSEGLEAAVEAGWVRDEAAAQRWLLEQLHLVAARSEMPGLAWAMKAWLADDVQDVRRCNDWILHTRESRELRLQTEQMGRSLADWLAQRLGADNPRIQALRGLPGGPTWPVAFALAGAQWVGPAEPGTSTAGPLLTAWAFGWAENQVQAAIKCVPLGQSAGQRILAELVREIPSAVQAALRCPPERAQAFAPGLAILSARHEQQYSRLFRS